MEESSSKSSLPILSPSRREGLLPHVDERSAPVSLPVYVIARSKATRQSPMLKEIASLVFQQGRNDSGTETGPGPLHRKSRGGGGLPL